MTIATIGLGSNLNNPKQQLDQACQALIDIPELSLIDCSSYLTTTPFGPVEQPDYLNAVARFHCTLSAHELLDHCQLIEQQLGRRRPGPRWGPRVIDLDILLFADAVVYTTRLVIPHPGLLKRGSVLRPLAEIAPDLILPNGQTVSAQLKQIEKNPCAFT